MEILEYSAETKKR